MARFLLKHLLYLCITLVVVSFLVFLMTEFSPGDVARKILGAYATPEQVAILNKEMGLERPVVVRYVEYVGTPPAWGPRLFDAVQGAGECDRVRPAGQYRRCWRRSPLR